MTEPPFWETTDLAEMSRAQWESLCDGCGLCCLHRFEDEDDGTVIAVPVACELLDVETCRCTDYANRKERVPMCIELRPDTLDQFGWLPDSCAYKRIAAGKGLPAWHHLVTGSFEACHAVGPGVAGQVLSERDADPYDALMDLLDASND